MEFVGVADEGRISWRGLNLLGAHNRDNVAAATALALSFGLRREQIDLSALSALPHRLELVFEAEGVRWINDSKATNVDAALVGLRAMSGPTILLLGGQGKEGADYSPLAAQLGPDPRVISFGASGPEIAAVLGGHTASTLAVPSLASAVQLARSLARPGDTVLLSPACASFDEFRDFEHRGRAFTEYARATAPKKGGAA